MMMKLLFMQIKMQIKIDSKSFFIFDLDDTLFPEVEFLKSAYNTISTKLATVIDYEIYEQMFEKYQKKENVFEWIITSYGDKIPHLSKDWLLSEYREHIPKIVLSESTKSFLKKLKEVNVPMSL